MGLSEGLAVKWTKADLRPVIVTCRRFEQIDLLGDRSEQLPQAIFFSFVEAKSLRKLTDIPDLVFSGSAYLVRRDRILHAGIL